MDPIEDYYRLCEEYDQLFHQENDLLQSETLHCTNLFLEKKAIIPSLYIYFFISCLTSLSYLIYIPNNKNIAATH